MGIGVTAVAFDTTGFDRKSARFVASVADPSRPLKQWAVAEGTEITRDWDAADYVTLESGPFSFRGVEQWKPVRPMYVRKTDGVAVYPQGGVRRIRAGVRQTGSIIATGRGVYGRMSRVSGNVKGRLRSSGLGSTRRRVSPTSIVGVSDNTMRRGFTRNAVLSSDRRSISLVGMGDAKTRAQNRLRRFAVLNAGSRVRLRSFCAAWVAEGVRRAGE